MDRYIIYQTLIILKNYVIKIDKMTLKCVNLIFLMFELEK